MIDWLVTLMIILLIVFAAASIIKFFARFLLKLGIFAFLVFAALYLMRVAV
ncbi:MAG: hypothetical protein R6U32_01465 [Candidatus Woesearchaeota archaeon]